MFWQDLKVAQQIFDLKKGDTVVMTGGQINGEPGNTNTIKVETIK
jgi:pyruvate kinase